MNRTIYLNYHIFNLRNRGPYPNERSGSPPNLNRHAGHMPVDYRRDHHHDDPKMSSQGFKRHNAGSPTFDHAHHHPMMMSGPHTQPYYNHSNYDRHASMSPSYYDNPPHHSSAKKQRRDWYVLEL